MKIKQIKPDLNNLEAKQTTLCSDAITKPLESMPEEIRVPIGGFSVVIAKKGDRIAGVDKINAVSTKNILRK